MTTAIKRSFSSSMPWIVEVSTMNVTNHEWKFKKHTTSQHITAQLTHHNTKQQNQQNQQNNKPTKHKTILPIKHGKKEKKKINRKKTQNNTTSHNTTGGWNENEEVRIEFKVSSSHYAPTVKPRNKMMLLLRSRFLTKPPCLLSSGNNSSCFCSVVSTHWVQFEKQS